MATNKDILLVEDDESICESVDMTLMGEGFDTVTAHDIATATTHLKIKAFKLILLDIRLKDGSGDQLIDKIRTQAEFRKNVKTPIIVISGHLDKELVIKMKGKIQAALVKPFDAVTLVNLIKKVSP
jgi:DNA-binding NtrC family response regulator